MSGKDAVVMNYTPVDEDRKRDVLAVKEQAADLWDKLDSVEQVYGRSRGLSLAKTKLEESVMWAVKALTNPGM